MKRSSFLAGFAVTLLSPSVVSAQSEPSWRSVQHPHSCALELTDPTGTALFKFDQQFDRYALAGELIDRFSPEDGSTPLVLFRAGTETVFLAGPPDSYERTNWDPPIQRITTLAEGEKPLVLTIDETETELPRAGFAEAGKEMRECLKIRLATKGARGPVFVSFDGIHQLASEATRQRMLSQKLGFTLTIDATGKPIECELSRKFRRRATEVALCRPLLKHMRFEPAIDSDGNPTTGRYKSEIDFDMWMTQRGYLEAEDR